MEQSAALLASYSQVGTLVAGKGIAPGSWLSQLALAAPEMVGDSRTAHVCMPSAFLHQEDCLGGMRCAAPLDQKSQSEAKK
eukprot:991990-Pelagomonas_calceolata.AAC.2